MQIQAGGSSITVKNCTLEDIDKACLSRVQSLRIELYTLLVGPRNGSTTVAEYYKHRLGEEDGIVGVQDWISCTLEQSQHQLPAAAVTLLRKIKR